MNLGGHATVAIAIFIIIMGALYLQYSSQVPPYTFSGSSPVATSSANPGGPDASEYCRAPAAGEVITFQAPRDEATKCPDGPNGQYKSGGTAENDFGAGTTYRLVRKNVPLNKGFFSETVHSIKAADAGIQTALDSSKYELYFPKISGEIRVEGDSPYSRTRDCAERSYISQGLIYFIDYGMAFGLVLKDGNPIDVGGFYLVDVFKDINREEIPQVAFDVCSTGTAGSPQPSPSPAPPKQVTYQSQSPDHPGDDLQLSWFLFSSGASPSPQASGGGTVNGWYDTCKPAIYLYPPNQMMLNVRVYPAGFLTYTDPVYDFKQGWNVLAYPDGTITRINISLQDQALSYPYLYYESKIKDEFIRKPREGWVVKFSELEGLYKIILPKLGLNRKQMDDFIEYWKKALPESPYYFVGIVDRDNIDQFEKLEIYPHPDYINRVRIYFERLEQPHEVQAPTLEDTGFTLNNPGQFSVVEWGGMVKNDLQHPFTCSQ